jgi:glycosyltransferase involved in cell wall biosynthesis
VRLAVVIGTYNERENLTPLIDGIRRNLTGEDLRIVVVDDNSPDGTGVLADSLAKADPRISVIHRPGKLGLGTAMRDGIQRALRDGAEAVATMDADLSHPPEALPRLRNAVQSGADIALGSRYVPGGRISGWSWMRKLTSATANTLTRVLTGSRVHDNTGNYRLVRRSVFDALDVNAIRSEGYAWQIEFAGLAQQLGFRITEVPIHFINRRAGASKINRSEILRAALTILRLSVQRKKTSSGNPQR